MIDYTQSHVTYIYYISIFVYVRFSQLLITRLEIVFILIYCSILAHCFKTWIVNLCKYYNMSYDYPSHSTYMTNLIIYNAYTVLSCLKYWQLFLCSVNIDVCRSRNILLLSHKITCTFHFCPSHKNMGISIYEKLS